MHKGKYSSTDNRFVLHMPKNLIFLSGKPLGSITNGMSSTTAFTKPLDSVS